MAIRFRDPGEAADERAPMSDPDDVPAALRRFSRIEDLAAGRAEEQGYVPSPAGPIFTTLVEPLGARRRVGFLVCHSFAFEQLDLFPLELTFARYAASAGFPTLYVQARGYADSGGDFGRATPASQLRDVLVATERLRSAGVDAVVPVGARWGAAVALMAADRLGAPGLVAWNPSFDPGAYLDGLLKVYARSRIVGKDRSPGEAAGPTELQLQAAIATGRDVDLFGYPLSRRCYREAALTRPLASLRRAPARALLVVVNPRNEREVREAGDRLRALGADVRVDHADGPARAQFGLGASPTGRLVVTSQLLFHDVARRTVAWADAAWPGTPEPTAPRRSRGPSPDDGTAGSSVTDVPVYIPSLGEQVGAVVSVPADRRSCVGVVLLAGRARSRAHRNGLLAKTAGTLAGQGMYALRLDYPGVGNSTGLPTLPGLDDMPSRTVEHACRFLLEHTPVRRILLAGTCYGGRVVLDAAPRIPEVDGVVLVAAPVLRPASSGTRLRLRSARARGRGRVDPGFVDALERFLPRGRVCFLYGDREDLLADLRVALDQLELPADRYELDLVPGEIHSFRSLAMQALTHERLSAWCRRSAEAMRERA